MKIETNKLLPKRNGEVIKTPAINPELNNMLEKIHEPVKEKREKQVRITVDLPAPLYRQIKKHLIDTTENGTGTIREYFIKLAFLDLQK